MIYYEQNIQTTKRSESCIRQWYNRCFLAKHVRILYESLMRFDRARFELLDAWLVSSHNMATNMYTRQVLVKWSVLQNKQKRRLRANETGLNPSASGLGRNPAGINPRTSRLGRNRAGTNPRTSGVGEITQIFGYQRSVIDCEMTWTWRRIVRHARGNQQVWTSLCFCLPLFQCRSGYPGTHALDFFPCFVFLCIYARPGRDWSTPSFTQISALLSRLG